MFAFSQLFCDFALAIDLEMCRKSADFTTLLVILLPLIDKIYNDRKFAEYDSYEVKHRDFYV